MSFFFFILIFILFFTENKEPHPGKLETFYDAKPKGSVHSSQEIIEEGKSKSNTDMHEPQPGSQNIEKRSVSLIEQTTLEEPKIKTSASVPTTMKQKSGVQEHSSQDPILIRKSSDGVLKRRHVPGIGAIVDAIQIQAVINYLEGNFTNSLKLLCVECLLNVNLYFLHRSRFETRRHGKTKQHPTLLMPTFGKGSSISKDQSLRQKKSTRAICSLTPHHGVLHHIIRSFQKVVTIEG